VTSRKKSKHLRGKGKPDPGPREEARETDLPAEPVEPAADGRELAEPEGELAPDSPSAGLEPANAPGDAEPNGTPGAESTETEPASSPVPEEEVGLLPVTDGTASDEVVESGDGSESSPGAVPEGEPPTATDAATPDETAEGGDGSGSLPPEEGEQQFLPVVAVPALVEAILLVSPEPVDPIEVARTFPELSRDEIEKAFIDLARCWEEEGRGIRVKYVAGGYRLETRPELDAWLDRYLEVEHEAKLSLAALETLAIVAYRQPITLPEINEIRGVGSSGVLRTLLERKLVRIHGRKPVVGSPFLYRTTKQFLEHFGLASLSELPKPEEMEQLLGDGVKLPGDLGQLTLPSEAPEETEGAGGSDEVELIPIGEPRSPETETIETSAPSPEEGTSENPEPGDEPPTDDPEVDVEPRKESPEIRESDEQTAPLETTAPEDLPPSGGDEPATGEEEPER
jgi:segregation and condensation protein B